MRWVSRSILGSLLVTPLWMRSPPANDGVVTVVRLDPDPPAAPMAAAEFVWDDNGRPAWGEMWGSFCELALFGGPPHRGADAALAGIEDARPVDLDSDVLTEVRRAIYETTGLFSEPADEVGWLAVSCDSARMAAWMAASIIMENVEARCSEEQLLVPISETYTLRDEIKSTITVVAKVHHYWREHVAVRT